MMTKEIYIKMTNLAFKYAEKYPNKDFTKAYKNYIAGFEAAYEIYNTNKQQISIEAKQKTSHIQNVSGYLSQEALIDMLDDKRVVGKILTEDSWYLCRKQAAEYLLDMCNITLK